MALDQKRKWTLEAYQERPDELTFCELVDGELVMAPAPTRRHQDLALAIAASIRVYLQQNPVGFIYIAPFDVRVNPAEAKIYHPDILYVSRDRAAILTSKSVQGPPDLVIEILSQGTAKYDLTEKKSAYEAAGVREYWAVWQDWPRVEVYLLDAAGRYGKPTLLEVGDTLTTALLPTFSLTLDSIYRDLPVESGAEPGALD